jgi:hypothetical protein
MNSMPAPPPNPPPLEHPIPKELLKHLKTLKDEGMNDNDYYSFINLLSRSPESKNWTAQHAHVLNIFSKLLKEGGYDEAVIKSLRDATDRMAIEAEKAERARGDFRGKYTEYLASTGFL